MEVTSSGIDAAGKILPQYTADGNNINPPLTFSQVPDKTASLTLMVEDPDAPNGTFTHWIVYDMSPATMQILDGSMPLTGTAGTNDFGNKRYDGPAPPSGTHRYVFTLYALDKSLGLPEGATKAEIQAAMDGHIIETAQITGSYSRG